MRDAPERDAVDERLQPTIGQDLAMIEKPQWPMRPRILGQRYPVGDVADDKRPLFQRVVALQCVSKVRADGRDRIGRTDRCTFEMGDEALVEQTPD